ncbi:MAG: hypothetical protein R2706_17930 [Acidimicrobiales bacterium]
MAFGAMAGIGVLAAIIVSMMALTGMFGPSVTTTVQPSDAVTAVDDEAGQAANATINATDDQIELVGTVPSQEVADQLHACGAAASTPSTLSIASKSSMERTVPSYGKWHSP